MHSPLSSVLKIERLLAAAEEVLSQELLLVPGFRDIHNMVSEALQCVTTERLRLEYRRSEPGGTGGA